MAAVWLLDLLCKHTAHSFDMMTMFWWPSSSACMPCNDKDGPDHKCRLAMTYLLTAM